jgi:LysM repeat protein
VQRLRELNGIPRNSSLIREGQSLVVSGGVSATVHLVARGETLSEIAADYGVKLSALREVNGMPHGSSMIREGQKLKLPAGATYREPNRHHVVRRGDTLLAIALRYGIRLSDLLRANSLQVDAIIRPGERLSIP